MSNIPLSKRLYEIAKHVPSGARIADIGADHALLLLYLAEKGYLTYGVISEIHQGPYERALSNVQQSGHASLIDVRLGDGFSVISPGEVDVVVIAGMGGGLIARILAGGKTVLNPKPRLILQPNNADDRVRRWLYEQGYSIVDESLIEEKGILYDVIVAGAVKKTETTSAININPALYEDPQLAREQLFQVGPVLWKKRHPLLPMKIQEKMRKITQVLDSLQKSNTDEARKKECWFMGEMRRWEQVMEYYKEPTL